MSSLSRSFRVVAHPPTLRPHALKQTGEFVAFEVGQRDGGVLIAHYNGRRSGFDRTEDQTIDLNTRQAGDNRVAIGGADDGQQRARCEQAERIERERVAETLGRARSR